MARLERRDQFVDAGALDETSLYAAPVADARGLKRHPVLPTTDLSVSSHSKNNMVSADGGSRHERDTPVRLRAIGSCAFGIVTAASVKAHVRLTVFEAGCQARGRASDLGTPSHRHWRI
jgi:hypothetical protein